MYCIEMTRSFIAKTASPSRHASTVPSSSLLPPAHAQAHTYPLPPSPTVPCTGMPMGAHPAGARPLLRARALVRPLGAELTTPCACQPTRSTRYLPYGCSLDGNRLVGLPTISMPNRPFSNASLLNQRLASLACPAPQAQRSRFSCLLRAGAFHAPPPRAFHAEYSS